MIGQYKKTLTRDTGFDGGDIEDWIAGTHGQTIISAAENPNGIIIRHIVVNADAVESFALIIGDAFYIIRERALMKSQYPIFVPAGVAVRGGTGGGSLTLSLSYDKLPGM
ncbi:hypothetical protein PsW64_03820 [Pseudovibrio sp. W64]|uniref:hypothetical protein n=1 Tax=Pseudovibrio sp. W64 TaxID=1735583 RepID=UPI0007AEBE2E|nr:hypothetical protein [Pseudovibrio sp. W64]KZK78181.1 hypothetical protein PsW64_03820 [Pseudovibrio sp. W64]